MARMNFQGRSLLIEALRWSHNIPMFCIVLYELFSLGDLSCNCPIVSFFEQSGSSR